MLSWPYGDRFRMTALGALRCARLANKTGTIVGRSHYANSISIRLLCNEALKLFKAHAILTAHAAIRRLFTSHALHRNRLRNANA
jgi:hypothetical protein